MVIKNREWGVGSGEMRETRIRDFQEINYPNKRTTETQRTQREEK
jgi:hypothetical protein